MEVLIKLRIGGAVIAGERWFLVSLMNIVPGN